MVSPLIRAQDIPLMSDISSPDCDATHRYTVLTTAPTTIRPVHHQHQIKTNISLGGPQNEYRAICYIMPEIKR